MKKHNKSLTAMLVIFSLIVILVLAYKIPIKTKYLSLENCGGNYDVPMRMSVIRGDWNTFNKANAEDFNIRPGQFDTSLCSGIGGASAELKLYLL